ncbi:hypothetical protein B0T22DRAFT_436927 [Podospora appendiculata]|uniref:Myosin class II heavy chain n=1 Tax=Podospora appendiculata TaxID=314037 RepID=A0AAE0XHX5_9PEZI|nr:hypothetical protein B0T22DRAFT_436927 [Podospora appendiculata]
MGPGNSAGPTVSQGPPGRAHCVCEPRAPYPTLAALEHSERRVPPTVDRLTTPPSTTSSPKSAPQTPRRQSAKDRHGTSHEPQQSLTASPALSSASTADGEASPELPPLPPPRLSERVLGLLRTPPTANVADEGDSEPNANLWGSPYPAHLRRQSLSSEASEESLIHHLELRTPFLRTVPPAQDLQPENRSSAISGAAAVLANRARRIAHGITEDWIRQHTAAGSDAEKLHWFSDGAGDSENSSLSGSLSGEEAAWLGDDSIRTPKASRQRNKHLKASPNLPTKKTSSETLRQAHLDNKEPREAEKMASSDERATPNSTAHCADINSTFDEPMTALERPSTPKLAGSVGTAKEGLVKAPKGERNMPTTPSGTAGKRVLNTTPRFKKKIPWRGKSVMVLLPRGEERGQPGQAPMPLARSDVDRILQNWEQLGYDTRGFDLDPPTAFSAPGADSQSRGAWPDFDDIIKERKERGWKVLLPDLNAWKKYVDELNEAKLRALGVSFGEDDPPPPSTSPGSTMSRQPSVTHYPPLPFSPPIPSSSASSGHAMSGYPFPGQFGTSTTQSPGIPAGVSPASFAKFNPRASISMQSPHAWSPQMILHHGHRAGSPSLANLTAMMSPTSPYSPDGMHSPAGHQRHQSLQFPVLPHQFQQQARSSPRLQDLREVEEEAPSKSPSKTPEPNFVHHNASNSLQREIDEAEYHLEEQMRSQIENDEDYSPHNENDNTEAVTASNTLAHAREPSVQFAPQLPRFGGDADKLILHHPRPHSRGHSLSQKYFTDEDTLQGLNAHMVEDSEIEVHPSNLGTPIQPFELSKMVHQRSFSTASNPWTDNESGKSVNGSIPRRPSHASKPSLSKLNVDAPEFKFNPSSTFKPASALNPTSTFKPAPFVFTNTAFTPTAFNGGLVSASSSQFSIPTTNSSKINVNAPVFSPGQSDFIFSASVPKFRPDAPAFTPHSLSNSVTSPVMSGTESIGKGVSAIFGSIDVTNADIVMPTKKSKAVPIVRPDGREEESARPDGVHEGPDSLLDDDSRIKRARATAPDDGDDDAVPRFAEPTEEATPVPESRPHSTAAEEDTTAVEDKSFDESNLGQADTTMSSTIISEATDTRATVSPAETSPDQAPMNWAPFEFNSQADLQTFAEARPFGDDVFQRGHNKSLSATAKAFVPGVPAWDATSDQPSDVDDAELRDEPVDQHIITGVLQDQDLGEEAADETVVDAIEQSALEPVQPSPPASTSSAAPESPQMSPARVVLPPPRVAAPVEQATSPPPPKRTGLAASRFAATLSPVPDHEILKVHGIVSPFEIDDDQQSLSPSASSQLPPQAEEHVDAAIHPEPSFADIDAIMRHLNQNPNMGINKATDSQTQWSPTRDVLAGAVADSSPSHLPPQSHSRGDVPSPSPFVERHVSVEASQPMLSTELEDPFLDPPHSAMSFEGPVHRLNGSESAPASEWDGDFGEDEQTKLESRVNFFDGHVNNLVGGLLAARLGPLENSLDAIKHALAVTSRRTPSSRRERRSISGEIQESDADDEDDEMPAPRRSMSPRRDRKMDQIRSAVLEALATQQRNQAKEAPPAFVSAPVDNSIVLKALDEMKEHFSQSLHLDFRGEDLRNIVEEAVESRMPPSPPSVTVVGNDDKINELQARLLELEQRLRQEEIKVETETSARRAAEDRAADFNRELQSAATKIEVEMMNKSSLNQRIADLEERVHHSELQAEEETKSRRAAEDRLSEIQRLLRISSEEETRLRDLSEEKDQKMKALESTHSKNAMRLALLEASQANAQQTQSEGQNRINVLEVDLRDARQEARHWRAETDRATDLAQRRDDDLKHALDENKALRKLIDTLGTQLQENERLRDNWRLKFMSIQEEMTQAAREVTEENARRTKKEQAMLARQDVLDARLQAEARTRERIETELERLEMGERQGMRAVAECKRLETLLGELRTENNKLHQSSLRYQAEFQEARESGAREVQRTRESIQAEVESANYQVNIVRSELEDQMSRMRAQLDQVRMDADTAKARHEMFLEEAQTSKKAELEELERKHQNDMEDLQARYERQINNTTEDAQRAEQNLLERLSISTSKSEYLQDKVVHLEEKLEIAKEAALAAVQAAKNVAVPESSVAPKAGPRHSELPEKISPQALRESIMVLQEQLQAREQSIEELEQALAKADPEAESKISKRDDEIIWLRELLAVRHSDLQDIIAALGREDYDKHAVKDAAIRLKANLQMEEQERERAMNGGSAINLPNIAATIRDAATPRVAQAVGPLAAAWGNWRKGRDPGSFGSLGNVLSSPGPASGSNSTPSKASPSPSSFLGGLLTPPASDMRQTPPSASVPQPTAFSNTGRRFTAQDLANRPRGISSTPNQEGRTAVTGTPPRRGVSGPMTPIMRPAAYDCDAQEDFNDADFFDD